MFQEQDEQDDGVYGTLMSSVEVTVPCHYRCCACLSECLVQYDWLHTLCGVALYYPCAALLCLLWTLQLPFTLSLKLLRFALCCHGCGCECCRGSMFIAQDGKLQHRGVLLQTADSICEWRALKASSSGNRSSRSRSRSRVKLSLLSWSVLGLSGRFWARYPLLLAELQRLDADMVCLSQAATSHWWLFSAVRSLRRLNAHYRGLSLPQSKALAQLQSMNALCCARPAARGVGVGKAIAFKDSALLFAGASRRGTAIRALYVYQAETMRGQLRLWVVSARLGEGEGAEEEEMQGVLRWMDAAQEGICSADAMVVCVSGEVESEAVGATLREHGFESAVKKRMGSERWTWPTDTWREEKEEEEQGKGKAERRCADGVWIKGMGSKSVEISNVQIVGKKCTDLLHKGEHIRVFPSDHLGIFVELSLG